MHNIDLILTLTYGLGAALLLGYGTHRIGLSPIVGYLLAGLAIGPNTPGIVINRDLSDQMAEIGVILLMFGVGLNFHFRELMSVRRIAIPGALFQSLTATGLGCLAGLAFGWGWAAGLIFGLAISVASTVVLVRVLADNNDLHTPAGQIAVGWLIVEDIFTVVVLVLLPIVFNAGGPSFAEVASVIFWALLKIAFLVVFIILVGGRLLPWLLSKVAETRSRELFTLTVLVLALGIAVGAAKGFGVSMPLGAFLAGMVIGRSDFSSRAASEALPMRDAFAVLFFVTVGMLFQPAFLMDSPGIVAVTLGIVLLGKPLAAVAIVLFLRYPPHIAFAVAVALAQIGEFSFILAALGRQLGFLPDAAVSAIVVSAIISISLNPLLYRMLDRLEKRAKRSSRWWSRLSARAHEVLANDQLPGDADDRPLRSSAVVVGYGPVGRTLVRLLHENEIEPTIIELNLETVRRLRDHGFRAVYGDATHRETIRAAGMDRAVVFILSSSGMRGSEEAIRLAREVNPKIRIFARANHLREGPALTRAGADVIFTSEGEVALTMTEFLLRQLGATAEQIDREKDRIRAELFGSPLAIEILVPPPIKKEANDILMTELPPAGGVSHG